MNKVTNVDEYISQFDGVVKERLNVLRKLVKEIVPQATETIAYQMPTYKLKKNLVHFAGYKNHIGFYPIPSGIAAFEKELAPYKTSKGAVQFPHDKPLPLDLMKRIIEFRVKEEGEKS